MMAVLALPCMAMAYDFSAVTPSGHTLYYSIVNGEAEVAKCNYNYPNYGSSLNGDLVIPDSVVYNGVVYPVTSIGHEAFEYATMRTVQIPNTVRTIVMRAFVACDSLTSLVIPNSVTSIGRGAFAGSFNIVSITLPDSLTIIEQGLFENDTSLVSVVIPDAVASVGYGAFSQCYSLRKVVFGQSVSSLGGLMFWNCRSLDTLVFKSDVAPSVGTNLFYETNDSLLIDIPCGTYHAYRSVLGTAHTYLYPAVGLTMTVASDMPDWGTATIVMDADSQYVRCDSSAVVQALPNYGYHFVQWSNGSTLSTDTLFLTDDSTVTATFAKNRYTLTMLSSDTNIGSVSAGGEFDYLDSVVVTATALAPYHFVMWSDGNTENPRTVSIDGNIVLTAIFGIDTFAVQLSVDSIAHGTFTGNGRYPYGAAASVVAIPYSGYQFSHWSDGSTYNPYTFAVVGDVQLTAIFYANGTPYQDTLVVHDTVVIHDTTYITLTEYDTIWLHDTIYVTTEGIDDIQTIDVHVYQRNGRIVVESGDGSSLPEVMVYDVAGRPLPAYGTDRGPSASFDVPATGVYLVKVGNAPVRRVVVVR